MSVSESLLGSEFMPIVHEDDRASTLEAMKALYHPPHTAYVEQRAMTKDGWRWFAWLDTAVLDDSGNVSSIIGAGRDIWEESAGFHPALPVALEIPLRPLEENAFIARAVLYLRMVKFDLTADIGKQLRLMVKRINMGDTAGHEEKDDTLCFCLEVRLFWCEWVVGCMRIRMHEF